MNLKQTTFRAALLLVLAVGSLQSRALVLTTQTITATSGQTVFNEPVFIAEGDTVTISAVSVTFNYDVTVRPKALLILTNAATVKMGNDRYIKLAATHYPAYPLLPPNQYLGGRLWVFNNSTVTSLSSLPTSPLWAGIKVVHSWTSAPSGSNVIGSNDPALRIDHGTIQYAKCAFSNTDTVTFGNNTYFAEGRIHAQFANFTNNLRSAKLWQGLFWYPNTPNSAVNVDSGYYTSSYFRECTFQLMPNFPYNPPDMIDISPRPQDSLFIFMAAVFQSCNFYGKNYQNNYYTGLPATTAVHVVNSGFVFEKAAGSANGCRFMGMKNGIDATGNLIGAPFVPRPFIVASATFMCLNSINLSGIYNPLIINDTFVTLSYEYDHNAIFLRNCRKYRVEGNFIAYDAGPSYCTGIIAMNSGVDNNLIYRNYILGCNLQLQAIGTNKDASTTTASGLKFICNDVINVSSTAGTGAGISVMNDIIPNTNNGIFPTQSYVSNTGAEVAAANSFPSYGPPTNINASNALDYYLETGTNDISTFVYKYSNQTTLHQIPYSRNFPNIALSNFNSCPVINTRPPQPLIPYMARMPIPRFPSFVQQLQSIEGQIASMKSNTGRMAINPVKMNYLFEQQANLVDSVATSYQERGLIDSLILTYQQVTQGYIYQIMLASTYTSQNQYSNAIATLNNIASRYTLTTEETVQINRLAAMYAVMQALSQHKGRWEELPASYKNTVYECEAKDPMYAGAAARALLVQYEGRTYEPIHRVPQNSAQPMMAKTKAGDNADVIYPNPATKQLNVTSKETGNTLDLVDMSGKVKMSVALEQGNNSINIERLSPGTYIATIKSGNAIIHQQKIVKQ